VASPRKRKFKVREGLSHRFLAEGKREKVMSSFSSRANTVSKERMSLEGKVSHTFSVNSPVKKNEAQREKRRHPPYGVKREGRGKIGGMKPFSSIVSKEEET